MVLSRWSQFRFDGEDFIGRSDASREAIAHNACEMGTFAEAQEAILDELLAGHTSESVLVHALRPDQHFISQVFLGRMEMGFTLGEHMPNGNQQFAGDSHNGFIGVLTSLFEILDVVQK